MKQKNETFIYTTPSVGMVVNVGLQKHLWMVTNRQPRQCFSITAVTFTAVLPTVSKTTPVSYSRNLLAWFVDEVTDARRMDDTDKEKVIFVEVVKLLGNSSYGKMIP